MLGKFKFIFHLDLTSFSSSPDIFQVKDISHI